jgi:cellulose synthase/poly-beta-1,6-N-acetylglucosamine synthase-like glycosyltransferase
VATQPRDAGLAQATVDVSVLIPTLDEEASIEAAARSMLGQRFDGSIEFLFIDGGSADRTPEILRRLADEDPRVRLLENPARFTPVALNIGLRAARGEMVCRMDAHSAYPPDYVALGFERLQRGGAEHVSGPQLPHGTGRWSRRVALALTSRLGTGEADFRHLSQDEIEVDSGFTGMWRRSTLLEQGGWDEGWPNDQDSELAARIKAAGGRIVCIPGMAAEYTPRDGLWRLARQYHRYGFFRAKTFRRHPETMRRSHVLAPGVLATAVLAGVLRGRVALAPRLALGVYGAALVVVSAGQSAPGRRVDALWLPAVFVTMHLAWGLGFVMGSFRFGPPLRALARVARGPGGS